MKQWILCMVLAGLINAASAQLLTWTDTSTLPIEVRGNVVVEYNGYVYTLGGRPTGEGAGTHAIADVYFAAIQPDGSLGSWTATTFLPGNRAVHGAHAYNDNMYVWGGWKEDYEVMNTCLYAPINPDGTLGTWVTSSVTIPDDASSNHQMDSFGRGTLGYGPFVYVLGGEKGDFAYSDQVYYSEIQPSGDYGAWQTTTALPFADWFHGVAIVEGNTDTYIFQVGGNHGGTSETHVFRNTINPDGSVGATWDQVGDLPIGLYEHGVAVVNQSIYVFGGLNGSIAQDSVYKLQIDPIDGGPILTTNTPMPATRARVAGVGYTVNTTEYVAIVGGGQGYDAAGGLLDSVIYSEVPVILSTTGWTLYE